MLFNKIIGFIKFYINNKEFLIYGSNGTFAITDFMGFLGTVPEQWTPTKEIPFIRKQEKSVSVNCQKPVLRISWSGKLT